MRSIVTALVSVAVFTGIAGTADAANAKKRHKSYVEYSDNSPSGIAERQRRRSTFDETHYYERDSNKIPLGTAAWWRQRQFENPGR